MTDHLYIAGTGTYSAEIASWAMDSGATVAALIELQDPERIGSTIHELPVVALNSSSPGSAVVGAGGDRRATWRLLAEAGWKPAGLTHPSAHLARSARAAASSTIGPLAGVGAEATIGEHSILSRGVLVGHHTRIGDYVRLNPGANVGGNAEIGDDAFIGMGAVILDHVRVGRSAVVAAGAVAIREVAAETRVQGVPAQPYPG